MTRVPATDLNPATRFGEIAETYDRLRPKYPTVMFDDLAQRARLSPGSRVLEIGCGTGIATSVLVQRGFDVCAIDPDPRMLTIARRRFSHGQVRFFEGRFEDYPDEPQSFDLIFVAGTWHWLDAESVLPRAASLIGPTGSLAICWNLPRPQGSPLATQLAAVHREIAREIVEGSSHVTDRTQEHQKTVIASSGFFEEPSTFNYQWKLRLSTRDYCDLLTTHSHYRTLTREKSDRVLKAVAGVIDDAGGTIVVKYETIMYLAQVSRP